MTARRDALWQMAASAAILLVSAPGALQARTPKRHLVEIRDFVFAPAKLRVAPGDIIHWLNLDIVPHTATADDGSWDSGEIAPGGDWRLTVGETTPGPYLCRYHPIMTGRIAFAGP